MTERCKVVITDLMDHSCLGFGVLSSIDHVGAHLAAPDAVCVPGRVVIRAALLSLQDRDGEQFRPPEPEPVPVAPAGGEIPQPYRRAPRRALRPLRSRRHRPHRAVASGGGRGDANEEKDKDEDEEKNSPAPPRSSRTRRIEVKPLKDGVWNAVAFWFELDMGGNQWLRRRRPRRSVVTVRAPTVSTVSCPTPSRGAWLCSTWTSSPSGKTARP